jgi:GTP-binding protein
VVNMLPVVALVGRPNVGKSTLFNRITKSRDALVADFPGLTRDRQYGQAKVGKNSFIVIDTAGIGVEDETVDELMVGQSNQALEEADIVLFMVDGRAGLTPSDETIANSLRQMNKPVYVVVNKTDGIDSSVAIGDFYALGFEHIIPISASHGKGVAALVQNIFSQHELPQEVTEDGSEEKDKSINIAFIGKPNVGKSTLVNRILGEERVVVFDAPGTTRDSIYIPFERDEKSYVLIDTAGVRKKGRIRETVEKFSVVKSLQAIRESSVCILVIDARENISEQDLHLLGFILEQGKSLVIAVNKWDGLDTDYKEHIKSELERRLRFINFAKIRFISALHGTGVGNLFDDINSAYTSAHKQFSTSFLTKILEDAQMSHQPPMVNGRRIKLRYAHTGGHNPPIIVIHGNQTDLVPESYRRYLMNTYIKALGLVGTPVKLEFKSSDNPYKDKKNKLSPRQQKKKKRLMKYQSKKK